jgi:hypothetical protein
MMTQVRANVALESEGSMSGSRSGLSPQAATQALLDQKGSRDVTLVVWVEGVDERLLAAIDGSRAFLGLERTDGLLQFVVDNDDQQGGTRPFVIGGQEVEIETRYLPELQTAGVVIREWLEGGEFSVLGHWERQLCLAAEKSLGTALWCQRCRLQSRCLKCSVAFDLPDGPVRSVAADIPVSNWDASGLK